MEGLRLSHALGRASNPRARDLHLHVLSRDLTCGVVRVTLLREQKTKCPSPKPRAVDDAVLRSGTHGAGICGAISDRITVIVADYDSWPKVIG
jgi:hypothetical protein